MCLDVQKIFVNIIIKTTDVFVTLVRVKTEEPKPHIHFGTQ